MSNLTKVQKKSKNKKLYEKSPFWAFAWEYRERMKRNGLPFFTNEELKERAGDAWNKLSQAQKDKYKDQAKNTEPIPITNNNRKKLDCLGQDIAEVEAKKKEQQEQKEAMKKEIKDLLDNANDIGELDTMTFYFISSSSFYEDPTKIYPAELAMAKFSLKKGVYDDFQIRINPGELPLGSALTARERSEKIHKYPTTPICEGEKDFMSILEAMMKFLDPLDKLPIFFTEGNDKITLQRTVERIFLESQEDSMIANIKIYPMEELLYQLQSLTVVIKNRQNGTNEVKFSSIVTAANKFQTDLSIFCHVTKGCEFHKNEDKLEYCCLSKVRRYGYSLVKWCGNIHRYEIIEGKHQPEGFQVVQ